MILLASKRLGSNRSNGKYTKLQKSETVPSHMSRTLNPTLPLAVFTDFAFDSGQILLQFQVLMHTTHHYNRHPEAAYHNKTLSQIKMSAPQRHQWSGGKQRVSFHHHIERYCIYMESVQAVSHHGQSVSRCPLPVVRYLAQWLLPPQAPQARLPQDQLALPRSLPRIGRRCSVPRR